MAASKNLVLKTYKSLLREAEKFSAYNFRMYALRRTRDSFAEHRHETDPMKIKTFIDEGQNTLKLMQRQVLVHNMYQTDRLVIEKDGAKRESASGRL